jgi:hypothetical protein
MLQIILYIQSLIILSIEISRKLFQSKSLTIESTQIFTIQHRQSVQTLSSTG